jgi:hypothetical protein
MYILHPSVRNLKRFHLASDCLFSTKGGGGMIMQRGQSGYDMLQLPSRFLKHFSLFYITYTLNLYNKRS